MDPEIRRRAIALYDLYTHVGMDRRAFMAEMTRIAGGTAAAALLLAGIAADPAAAAIVPPQDPRLRSGRMSWPLAGGRRMTGYQAEPRRSHCTPVTPMRGWTCAPSWPS